MELKFLQNGWKVIRRKVNRTYPSPGEHSERTVKDFGEQWSIYADNEGFYGSFGLFWDIVSPLLKIDEIKDCKVAEIGSGTGRIVNMLLDAGARQVIAVEPSVAFKVLQENIRDPAKVTCLNITGERLPAYGDLDYVFSIGVLHHIPDPRPVIEAAFQALRPGGKFLKRHVDLPGSVMVAHQILVLSVKVRILAGQ